VSDHKKSIGLGKDPFTSNPIGSLVRAEPPTPPSTNDAESPPTLSGPREIKRGRRTKADAPKIYSVYLSEEERDTYEMLLTRLRVKYHVRLTFSEFVRLALRPARRRLEALSQQGNLTLEDVEREIQQH
jgi:hypothetical protein